MNEISYKSMEEDVETILGLTEDQEVTTIDWVINQNMIDSECPPEGIEDEVGDFYVSELNEINALLMEIGELNYQNNQTTSPMYEFVKNRQILQLRKVKDELRRIKDELRDNHAAYNQVQQKNSELQIFSIPLQ